MSEKYHVLVNTIFSVTYTLGGILVGLAAMYVHNFRVLMWMFYIPGLLTFVYIWLVPESFRWLLATGRIDRAIETMKRIAKSNRRELSEKTIHAIKFRYSRALNDNAIENQSVFLSLWMVLKSKNLCVRFFCCCFQWIAWWRTNSISKNVYFWNNGRNCFFSVVYVISSLVNHPFKYQTQIIMLAL